MAIALGSLAAATGAHAGVLTNAVVSVSVGAPVHHVQPAPVSVQPALAYAQPRMVQGPHRRYEARGPWGDADHDGVPNRDDRAPNNPYRR